MLHNLMYGFHVAFQVDNLLFCAMGVLLGTLVGVLPGIGPVGAMALLLPATFSLSPTASLIMLAGIWYGSQYGGSTTSILVNIPGEATSVITCLDGYQLARQGRAGPALAMAAYASFIAGTFSLIGLMLLAIPLGEEALRFGPPEYFSLMCAGLVLLTFLAQKSFLKAIMMATVGILLSTVGIDLMSGLPRFTFGIDELVDGISISPIVMGLFGVAEILDNLDDTVPGRGLFRGPRPSLPFGEGLASSKMGYSSGYGHRIPSRDTPRRRRNPLDIHGICGREKGLKEPREIW